MANYKICILQGAFLPIPPALGGAVEKMWFLLGQNFASKGHRVTHVSRSWSGFPQIEVMEGVFHKRVSGFSTPKNGLWLKVLDLVYTLKSIKLIPKNSDIIITNTFWAPIILPFFFKSQIYVDVARMPKGQMRLYKNAARLKANSEAVAVAIKSELPSKLHHLVSVIPNPLPYVPNKTVDFSTKKPVILFAGRMHPEKGLDLLKEAVLALPPKWKIKIVGPWDVAHGGGGDAYITKLKSLFSSDCAEFIAPIYDIEKLNHFYQEASIFVYPSVAEKGETFGLAPLEAMAWGCVPVVSDLDCFKDFINDGVNGLVFNHRVADAQALLNSCIQRLMSDGDLYERLALKALNVRETHSADAIADMFLKDFKKCMVGKNG